MTPSHPSSPLPPHGTRKSYAAGYGLSILLTLAAFWAASALGGYAAVAIVLLAFLQLVVQLVYFLHMGRESGKDWNTGLLMFTLVIICILVGGTLWIMTNLARLHMPEPTPTDLYQNGVVAPQNELN